MSFLVLVAFAILSTAIAPSTKEAAAYRRPVAKIAPGIMVFVVNKKGTGDGTSLPAVIDQRDTRIWNIGGIRESYMVAEDYQIASPSPANFVVEAHFRIEGRKSESPVFADLALPVAANENQARWIPLNNELWAYAYLDGHTQKYY
jgi:hypothetical protein